MKAALYARVSTKDKGQETENQLRELRSWCKKNSYTITKEYIDKESGRKSDRPEFITLFEDARHRKFDVVIFWALDRFSREGVRPTLSYLQQLEDYGVSFRSYTEQYFDTAGSFRDVIISIMAVLAKQEAVRQSERVKAGLERAKSQGKKLGRPTLSEKKKKAIQRDYNQDPRPSLRQLAKKHGCGVETVRRVVG